MAALISVLPRRRRQETDLLVIADGRSAGTRAFLTFTLTERPALLTLAITVPEAARDAAELLLAAFQEKNASVQSCGCTGACAA